MLQVPALHAPGSYTGPILRILHTNDFHGKLAGDRLESLHRLREDADFYFDCGDAIAAGNLAIPLRQDPVWQALAELRCTASVPGNRESHVLEAGLKAKIAGLEHPLLCANWYRAGNGRVFPPSLEIDSPIGRVGVLAVMVPMVTERMASKAASAFRWTSPIDEAQELAKHLRPRVEVLIAITHIGLRQDRVLAEECPEVDLILGGHSHDVLNQPEYVGKTAICQTGSHARFAGLYSFAPGKGILDAKLIPLS